MNLWIVHFQILIREAGSEQELNACDGGRHHSATFRSQTNTVDVTLSSPTRISRDQELLTALLLTFQGKRHVHETGASHVTKRGRKHNVALFV